MEKNTGGVNQEASSGNSRGKLDGDRPSPGSNTTGKEQEERFKLVLNMPFPPSQKVSCGYTSSHGRSFFSSFTLFSKIPPFSILSSVTFYLLFQGSQPNSRITSQHLVHCHAPCLPPPRPEQCMSSNVGVEFMREHLQACKIRERGVQVPMTEHSAHPGRLLLSEGLLQEQL